MGGRRELSRRYLAFAFAFAFVCGCTLLVGTEGLSDRPPDAGASDAGTPEAAPGGGSYGLGDGRHGALTVDRSVIVNAYFPLGADAPAGATELRVVATGSLASGDLVLLWQVRGDVGSAIGDPGPISLTGSAGRYELVRVVSVAADTIAIDAPLGSAYAGGQTQLVRIPQHTDVTVTATGRIDPRPWDGEIGGVVALFATGTLTIEGAIQADGAGFRGGPPDPSEYKARCEPVLDGDADAGYAPRGEGMSHVQWGTAGRGNVVNGGGGGACHNAGGGGGGNGSAGGGGGRGVAAHSVPGADVGGLGGAALVLSLRERLTFGGGGGTGESNNLQPTTGAPGGGVVFLRARSLSGSGVISANGATAASNPNDGAGGGGAGGSVVLQTSAGAACGGPVRALGGNGGGIDGNEHDLGPGGGGGGGRVLVQGPTGCLVEAASGIAGIQLAAAGGDAFRGATPTTPQQGVIEIVAEPIAP